MDSADVLASGEVRHGARHPHHSVEAAGGEAHRRGGLGEEAPPRLVRRGHGLEAVAVHLGIGPDPLALVAPGLDLARRGDSERDLRRAFGRRRQDEIGCESWKVVGPLSAQRADAALS